MVFKFYLGIIYSCYYFKTLWYSLNRLANLYKQWLPVELQIQLHNKMLLKILSLLTCLLCLQEVSATYGYKTKCNKPDSPLNGNVTMTTNHFGYQKLIYSCNAGYKLVGKQIRTCYNGAWAGCRPICQPISE